MMNNTPKKSPVPTVANVAFLLEVFDVYSMVIDSCHDTFATLLHFARFLYGGLNIIESCVSEFHVVRVDITVIASIRVTSSGGKKKRNTGGVLLSIPTLI